MRGIGKTFDALDQSVYAEVSTLSTRRVEPKKKADSWYSLYFDRVGRVDETPVYLLDNLGVGDAVEGPAMITDQTQTIGGSWGKGGGYEEAFAYDVGVDWV